ncbi:uncharacterized protein LOC135501404 [Lineus longissimus]|uniref:uncharacterized protein LOC135501404 n=1 Tax=Lineus longissimus TaxID=88925 RepID=UPI002B4E97DD
MLANSCLVVFLLSQVKLAAGVTTKCISPKPIAFWPLDGTHQTNDVSGYNHHATPFGVSVSTGFNNIANAAYEFQGNTNSYLKITRTPMLDVGATGSFSYAAMVYPTSNTGCFIEWPVAGAIGPYIWNFPGKCVLIYWNARPGESGAATNINNKPALTLSKWTFLGVVYDYGTGTMRITLDTTTTTLVLSKVKGYTNVPEVYIGKRPFGAYASSSYYKGKMANVMLWNQALTEDEMMKIKDFDEKKVVRVATSNNAFTGYKPFINKASDRTIVSSAVIGTQTENNAILCAIACINKSQTCVTIGYAKATRECKMSEKKFESGVTDEALAGSVIYEISADC